MGQALIKLQKPDSGHVLAYQQSVTVRQAAQNWQAARQRRLTHLSMQEIPFGTGDRMIAKFTWAEEITMRYGFPKLSQLLLFNREQEMHAEQEIFNETNDLAKKQHTLAWLSKPRKINSLTAFTLLICLMILLGSIMPIDTGTEPGKRDVIEASLEVGEKFFAFIAVTAKTYFWRVATFAFVAGFSIIKKGLAVHFDPAPARVVGPNWAFAGALTAKAFEHLAYAVRLTPASKAWESLHLESMRESNYLSTEQWVRRCMWAASHYEQHLLDQQQLRIKIDMEPRVENLG